MHVSGVTLKNWLRYAGEHEIDLKPSVYGIVARHAGDDRRSNWAGKTSFIEAIRFALYGVHRFAREDDWITRGIAFGQVAITLSDGTVITRSRRRGQSTQLELSRGGEVLARQDGAQKEIDRMVGLTREDFETTCWIGQKQLARLILARSAERFDLVSAWLGLEKLQKAEDAAKAQYAHDRDRATKIATEQKVLTDRWMQMVIRSGIPDMETASGDEFVAAVTAEIGRVESEIAALTTERDRAMATVREQEAARAARRVREQRQEEFARIANEGKALSATVKELGDPPDVESAKAAHEEVLAKSAGAASALRTAKSLVRGAFDGLCPVAGIACPAKDAINADGAANKARYETAKDAYDAVAKQEAAARLEYEERAREAEKIRRQQERLVDLRKRAKEAKARLDAEPELPLESTDDAEMGDGVIDALNSRIGAAMARLKGLTGAVADAGDTARRLEDAAIQARAADAAMLAGQAAVRILGRQGAQRVIAEAALREIEEGANDMLRSAGIDLSVTLSWAREGSGLAAHCSECGTAFPASARVKACAKCGAERGQKVIERLDVELSDRSGAAEDLAGAALQLAATAWLRRERDVAWSVALIDEPFGALDEANRRAFATHLTAMLRGAHGFEQAFIVAHHPDVIDALPDRVIVRAGETGSTLEVA